MAKIFRISGYLVTTEKRITPTIQANRLYEWRSFYEQWQQLHIEESEEFELDGEDESNCDLALLTRHFKADTPVGEYGRPLPQTGEKYRHFKIGKVVTIVDISRHTETEEVDVVYDHEGKLWCRPLDMFMSEVDKVKYPDATQKYRFEKVVG